MNDMVKVYGHKRSGNNFLCSLIYYNFFPDMVFRSGNDKCLTKFCTLPDGKKVKYSPWGALFGSHDENVSSIVDFSRIIYIKRDVEDTCASYQAFMKSIGRSSPNDDMVKKGIQKHHESWDGLCYTIQYENLVNDPIRELEKISKHFGLERKSDSWWVPGRKVGWNPRD